MTEKTSLSLQLAEKDVERIIGDTIKAQVAAAFAARGGQLAEEVVSSFLSQGVDYNGRPTGQRASRNERTYVNTVVSNALEGAMKSAVLGWVAENEEKLRKTVVTTLNRKRGDIASQLVASLVDTATDTYRCRIGITLGIPNGE